MWEAFRDPLGAQADSVSGARGAGSPFPVVTPGGKVFIVSGHGASGVSGVLLDSAWLYKTP